VNAYKKLNTFDFKHKDLKLLCATT